MVKKASDFRYNTGATRVPWAAVGENYNAQDLMAVIRFLAQGEGEEYEKILGKISEEVEKLTQVSSPPGKLSLGTQVEKAEEMVDKYLGSKGSLSWTTARLPESALTKSCLLPTKNTKKSFIPKTDRKEHNPWQEIWNSFSSDTATLPLSQKGREARGDPVEEAAPADREP
jgi:hypothetical protein